MKSDFIKKIKNDTFIVEHTKLLTFGDGIANFKRNCLQMKKNIILFKMDISRSFLKDKEKLFNTKMLFKK